MKRGLILALVLLFLAPTFAMGKDLKRREKRQLGILPRQVIGELRRLAKEGDITKDMSNRDIAAVIAIERASSKEYGGSWNKAKEGKYSVDWDSILAFLEGVVELLLKILPIFMDSGPGVAVLPDVVQPTVPLSVAA